MESRQWQLVVLEDFGGGLEMDAKGQRCEILEWYLVADNRPRRIAQETVNRQRLYNLETCTHIDIDRGQACMNTELSTYHRG